jgi:hypothetical protein
MISLIIDDLAISNGALTCWYNFKTYKSNLVPFGYQTLLALSFDWRISPLCTNYMMIVNKKEEKWMAIDHDDEWIMNISFDAYTGYLLSLLEYLKDWANKSSYYKLHRTFARELNTKTFKEHFLSQSTPKTSPSVIKNPKHT